MLTEAERRHVEQLEALLAHEDFIVHTDGVALDWMRLLVALVRRQEEELERVLAALRLIDAEGHRASNVRAPEDVGVRALCEVVGFGAVMDSAARQWFLRDPVGALTVGPTAGTVRAVLAQHP